VGLVFEERGEHAGHRIQMRKPGFEFTPMMLGKIAAFVVRPPADANGADSAPGVFAFMYPLLSGELDEGALLEAALAVIRDQIDRGHLAEHTYEWRNGGWSQALRPRWWVSVSF
jgi:hypothetical protein